MLESKIWEEAEQKSKVFLRGVMGDETFDEFVKNGKIEIKSGDTTYELYENGNVINKTTNQKYCIVTDRSDYPSYDVIAIKFAWLKYGKKTVERVANRTDLGTVRSGTDDYRGQQGNIASYAEFVHYMESSGWAREQLTVSELSTSLVSTHSVERDNSGSVIEIRCPAGRIITIMGTNQVPHGADGMSANTFAMRITDKDDVEISGNTHIRIEKISSYGTIRPLEQGLYASFSLTRQIGNDTCGIRSYKTDNEWYRWRHGIHLMGCEVLRISILNSAVDINWKNVRMSMGMDLWVN